MLIPSWEYEKKKEEELPLVHCLTSHTAIQCPQKRPINCLIALTSYIYFEKCCLCKKCFGALKHSVRASFDPKEGNHFLYTLVKLDFDIFFSDFFASSVEFFFVALFLPRKNDLSYKLCTILPFHFCQSTNRFFSSTNVSVNIHRK